MLNMWVIRLVEESLWLQQSLRLKTLGFSLGVRVSAEETGKIVRDHSWVIMAGLFMVCSPALMVILLSGENKLEGFDIDSHEANLQIAELLKGERLVPPAALPPEFFITKEVQLIRPQLADASRNWGSLEPGFEQVLLRVFKVMQEKHGYSMAIIEGYRSPERQNMLAALGSQVTNAKAFQSYHQFGLAADCAFLRDGKLVISEKDPWAMRGYQLYGEVAEELGLRWGGRWKMMDLGHVELALTQVLKH